MVLMLDSKGSVCSQLDSDPNIVIAKMNAVENDIPLGYDVQG